MNKYPETEEELKKEIEFLEKVLDKDMCRFQESLEESNKASAVVDSTRARIEVFRAELKELETRQLSKSNEESNIFEITDKHGKNVFKVYFTNCGHSDIYPPLARFTTRKGESFILSRDTLKGLVKFLSKDFTKSNVTEEPSNINTSSDEVEVKKPKGDPLLNFSSSFGTSNNRFTLKYEYGSVLLSHTALDECPYRLVLKGEELDQLLKFTETVRRTLYEVRSAR